MPPKTKKKKGPGRPKDSTPGKQNIPKNKPKFAVGLWFHPSQIPDVSNEVVPKGLPTHFDPNQKITDFEAASITEEDARLSALDWLIQFGINYLHEKVDEDYAYGSGKAIPGGKYPGKTYPTSNIKSPLAADMAVPAAAAAPEFAQHATPQPPQHMFMQPYDQQFFPLAQHLFQDHVPQQRKYRLLVDILYEININYYHLRILSTCLSSSPCWSCSVYLQETHHVLLVLHLVFSLRIPLLRNGKEYLGAF